MTKEEYEKRLVANHKLEGVGLEVTVHAPCPFCAEKDWCIFPLIKMEEETSKEHVCKACGRGAKMIYNHTGGGTAFRIVQTCGEDPPSYVPLIPREDLVQPINNIIVKAN